jgi:N6-L-threonylcarbamoyladenine synthase
MRVLGIESSCDETGVAVFDTERGMLAHRIHSQIDLHAAYGGVVPELASRDHIRRLPILLEEALAEGGLGVAEIDAVAYTAGPGLAGALLAGASVAVSLAAGLAVPALAVHHLEGHLLSPLLSRDPPEFPFVALLVSGGHTQLMEVTGVGCYRLLGETVDDAAGEAFDKTAKLMGLPYPGGPALAKLADHGQPGGFSLPRPMLRSGDLDFSFSGLKTAVLTTLRHPTYSAERAADLAAEFQEAVVEVLSRKSLDALRQTGLARLVVAGGVGANVRLRQVLNEKCSRRGWRVFSPEAELCTDPGAMIAFAGALRLVQGQVPDDRGAILVKPRWDLHSLSAPRSAGG